MLQIAANWLEQEATEVAAAKETYMEENCPAPDLSGDMAAMAVSGPKHSAIKNLVNFPVKYEYVPHPAHFSPQLTHFLCALTGFLQKTVPVPGQDR